VEKEKKTRTAKNSVVAELTATAPKKTASKKKTVPSEISVINGSAAHTNGSALKNIAPRKSATPVMTAMNVSHDQIARLAHRYWAERGHQHGHHVEDWLRAERELVDKAS
jgi:hypothetical protein